MRRPPVRVFSLIVLVIAAAAIASHAQNFTRMSVNVPFKFVAGDATLPSGSCLIERPTERGVDKMHLRAGKTDVIVSTNSLKSTADPMAEKRTGLLFHRYGDDYFLAEIWINGHGVQLVKSAREVELEESGPEMKAVMLKVKMS